MPATYGTVVNPTRKLVEYLSTHASNTLAKSLVAIATPNFAAQLKTLASEFPHLQTVGVACDTVPLGCQRSGFSWLVSEHAMAVRDSTPLTPLTNQNGDRNWHLSTAAFRMTSSISPSFDLAVPAANTLFSTGNIAEIYCGGTTPLQALHIELAERLVRTQQIVPAQPLTGWKTITGVADNMLKTLDESAAARFLEESPQLKTAVEPAVFAELDSGEMIRVVAGGGGLWSPRSSMLVLEPPAAPRRGQKLRFWLEDPLPLTSDLLSQLENTPSNGVIAEVAPVPQSITEERGFIDVKSNHVVPVFGFGSERGFFDGDHKHSIVGESLYFH